MQKTAWAGMVPFEGFLREHTVLFEVFGLDFPHEGGAQGVDDLEFFCGGALVRERGIGVRVYLRV